MICPVHPSSTRHRRRECPEKHWISRPMQNDLPMRGKDPTGEDFSGLTLEQFRATFKPCRDVERRPTGAQVLFRRQKLRRSAYPSAHRPMLFAPIPRSASSAMYSTMGYVPKYRRRLAPVYTSPSSRHSVTSSSSARQPKRRPFRSVAFAPSPVTTRSDGLTRLFGSLASALARFL